MTDITSLYSIGSNYIERAAKNSSTVTGKDESFGSVFQSALNMINETNQLQNNAETAEINFALGYSNNTHDLTIAQEKANVALQYTVAVRDRFLEAYKEIMNMQI